MLHDEWMKLFELDNNVYDSESVSLCVCCDCTSVKRKIPMKTVQLKLRTKK